MERQDQREPQPNEHAPRRPYEAPRLQVVELLPEETLGIGCKTQSEVSCQVGFNFGS